MILQTLFQRRHVHLTNDTSDHDDMLTCLKQTMMVNIH
uniref:Uncharacterized protein n=1 Tax=Arundo donax TaxID=35708 RepID=A0A0A9F1X5_ARUDO